MKNIEVDFLTIVTESALPCREKERLFPVPIGANLGISPPDLVPSIASVELTKHTELREFADPTQQGLLSFDRGQQH